MSRLPLFVLEFVGISAPLTWAWMKWGSSAYGHFLARAVNRFASFLGVAIEQVAVPDRFVGYVPFLVLVLLTPRIQLVRRIAGTIGGFLTLFLGHSAILLVVVSMEARGTAPPVLFPDTAYVLLEALPFLLWAVVARDFLIETLAPAPPALDAVPLGARGAAGAAGIAGRRRGDTRENPSRP